MTADPRPNSRRTLLRASVGAVVAYVATALGRPRPAAAVSGDNQTVLTANSHTGMSGPTHFEVNGGPSALSALVTGSEGAMHGSHFSISGSAFGRGLRGSTNSLQGWGVHGESPYVGVYGVSSRSSGYGVGTYGDTVSAEGRGVFGRALSGTGGTGVFGQTESAAGVGVRGLGYAGSGTGVYGSSGEADWEAPAPPKVGVYGRSTVDSSARGVFGYSTTGQGVRGQATTGTAGYFLTPVDGGTNRHTGSALVADGRVKFPNCAGVAAVGVGATFVDVTPGIALAGTTAAIASITGASVGVSVVRTAVNTTTHTVRIHLSGAATAAGKVAWHVFG